MKPAFKSAKRLGKKLSSVFLGCLLAVPFAAVAQPQGTYISPAIVTTAPQVDATNFFNAGVWGISTFPFPYKTSHTLNYTNTGTMIGSVGWEFDYGPLFTGARGWSANFFNDSHATIAAVDGPIISSLFTIDMVGYLLISATNIVNRGTLTAGPNGEIILNGSQVNLSRSQLGITPIPGIPGGSINNTSTNFLPDTAIYDQYWSGGNSNVLSVGGSPWDDFTATVGRFTGRNARMPCGAIGNVIIGPFSNPTVADSYSAITGLSTLLLTNMGVMGDPTVTTTSVLVNSNEIRQAVFVFVNDTNITAINHFTPSLISTNPFNRVAVQLSTISTNILTLTPQTITIYLVDDLAGSTNRGLVTNSFINPNAACGNPTARPSSVMVSRTDPGFVFASGAPGFGPPSGTFFYDPLTFSNRLAFGVADVYSARVDNLAAEPPPGFSISNAPGKIFINAKDLDLSKTRISGASEVLIQAANLISSLGAAIDCQNLSYNFGSTNGLLNVVNLAGQNIQRLHGTINEWSGLWTNSIVTVYPNFTFDTTTSNWISAPLTNLTEVDLAITVVDAGGLITTIPVIVQDLILHSTNMTVSDSMTVANALLFDGQGLTIQGALSLSGSVQNWNSATAPTLRFFTNNGVLQIPIDAHFGDDRVPNYAAFVNHGVISSGGQTIDSDYLELNGGTNRVTAGNFMALCRTGLVMNTEIIAAGDIQFFANTLKIDPSILSAGGAINFTVTNSLADAGVASSNTFICENGFNLVIKPATGDLLGTTVINTALGQDEVDNVWAGRGDFGASAAGYSNNVAIGTLILNQASAVFEPLFRFTGANATNGLYVNHLDLSTLTDYANELEIDPNLTIYFMSASLGTNVDITPSPSAEAFLDGQFGGHLRWVHGAAGPATTLSAASYNKNAGTFQFSIASQPGQTNVIQASTNLLNWIPIYTNVGSSLFVDPNATNFPYRFYRDLLLGP